MFPICMGINRVPMSEVPGVRRVPHMHGDKPTFFTSFIVDIPCSPYAWG
ncbi:protein of unknown function [Xenorhabdus poinarii G6]|uniref:Uncharacterized protein n=1 Tax=Xenorhabdus poinarii G6 TaxID=1354304 RepID=A0A068QZF7_9GAMM|nr:protein of unknown function [Xenorhabdus poinarii G6]